MEGLFTDETPVLNMHQEDGKAEEVSTVNVSTHLCHNDVPIDPQKYDAKDAENLNRTDISLLPRAPASTRSPTNMKTHSDAFVT